MDFFYIAFVLISVWLLWVMYVAVMALKRARDANQLTPAMKALGYPLLAVGLLWDCLLNATVFSVLFLELPREWLVTARLIRHKRGKGWRAAVARWFCASLLDSLDPSGCHCKTDAP